MHGQRPTRTHTTPHTRTRPSRRSRLFATALTLALATGGGLAATEPAAAAGQSVVVDLRNTHGSAAGVGSGFLYGLSENGQSPDDSLLAPLAPRSARGGGARLAGGGWVGDGYTPGTGYQRRLNSALAQARRLATPPYNGTYDLLVSDIWGADTTQPASTVYPCTAGNCDNWRTFLRRLTADVRASGIKVRYDIWNEPAGAFFPPGFNSPQYYQMWDTAVRELRAADPSTPVVGPSLWDFSPNNVSPFLDHTKAAGTVPDIVNWHFSGTPVEDAATMRQLLASKGLTARELTMNEYLHADEQNAGHTAWYLTQLAESGIQSASHAIWSDCCASDTLDGILVRSGGQLRPTGQWWVYKAYADMAGSLAQVDTQGDLDALASVDPTGRRATVLIGGRTNQTPAADLDLRGLTTGALSGGSGVTVTVQRIPDQGPLESPTLVSTQTVPAGTDTVRLSLSLSGTAAHDAFLVTAVPARSDTVTVDATVASGPVRVAYGTGWGRTNGVPDMHGQTANWSFTPGSTAVVGATGRRIALKAVRDRDQGRMRVSIDGGVPVTVDNYAGTRTGSATVWTSPALPNGPHTVTITVAPDRNPASTGHNIALDAVEVQR
ncbi:beta-xylosidase [Streptomyces sp. NPDC088387]|uniref:beta-xylosidase n=1 Tax=Streptomyces sp. NPDC088387 TaxID=3365859 RepID=UPI00380AD575